MAAEVQPPPPPPRLTARPRRALERHLGSEGVARVTYGAIIGMALIVVLQSHPPSAAVVAGTLLSTALAVALAELYSELIGHEMRTRTHLGRHQIRHVAGEVAAVAFGVAFPCVFFFAAAAGLIELAHGVPAGQVVGAGADRLLRLLRGPAGRRPPAGGVAQALAVMAIGALLIAFKAVVH